MASPGPPSTFIGGVLFGPRAADAHAHADAGGAVRTYVGGDGVRRVAGGQLESAAYLSPALAAAPLAAVVRAARLDRRLRFEYFEMLECGLAQGHAFGPLPPDAAATMAWDPAVLREVLGALRVAGAPAVVPVEGTRAAQYAATEKNINAACEFFAGLFPRAPAPAPAPPA